jgi:cytochrome c553
MTRRAWLAAGLLLAGPGAAQGPDLAACTACHGGAGERPARPEVPALGGQPELYLLYQLVYFRQGQRKNPEMAMVREMGDAALRASARAMAALPHPPPPPAPPDPARRDRGAELAATHRCPVCHGQDYAGGQHLPRLAGQQEAYLLAALRDFAAGRRIGIQAAMAEALAGLDAEDLADLAHYLAHL